jgi:hypothetical protein
LHTRFSESISWRRVIVALAMTCGLMATGSIVTPPPAAAGDHGPIYTSSQYGSARFKAYGDHVFLCDHFWDGHSVAVKLAYQHETKGYVNYWRWNWWGPFKYNGCKDLNLAVKENTIFKYKVCLGENGHPGGQKADVLEWSCSGVASTWNNG